MRIRRGFVSNSSTTSFCIYGTPTNDEVWAEARVNDLECHAFDDFAEYNYAVGISWSEIQDHETAGEFKLRVQALVKQIFPNATDFGTYKDAYRDG